MATLRPSSLSFRNAILLCLFLFFFTSLFLSSASSFSDDDQPLPKKKSTTSTSSSLSATKSKPTTSSQLLKSDSKKNQTTSKKTSTTTATDSLSSSSKNHTKLLKTSKSSNSTKSSSTTKSSSDPNKATAATSELKLKKKSTNSTNDSTFPQLLKQKDKKQLNSTTTKTKSLKDSDPIKLSSSSSSSKNKTTSKSPAAKKSQTLTPNSDSTDKKKQTTTKSAASVTMKKQPRIPSSWIEPEDEEEGDLVAEFRDLPSKFQQHLIPDLERISMTSRKYLTKANKEMTRGFKPIVGNKYAATTASVVSFAFIIIPLLLVSLIVNRIKAYFSLQKLLIFVQVYLSIYFSILCLSSLATGLEPLRFFYASAGATYFGIMLFQTLAYLFYLFLLLVYLVLVFSPSSAAASAGMGTKMMGLGQVLMGFAIGVHLYVAVFHRVLLHQPPKTNWKVHGIYAACFLLVSLLAGAERRKKAYLEEGGEEGKLN